MAAASAPASPDPTTDPGALLPPRASAIPSLCFCASLSFVTADPATKYPQTIRYPLHPKAAKESVPSKNEAATAGGVNPAERTFAPRVKTTELITREGRRPGEGGEKAEERNSEAAGGREEEEDEGGEEVDGRRRGVSSRRRRSIAFAMASFCPRRDFKWLDSHSRGEQSVARAFDCGDRDVAARVERGLRMKGTIFLSFFSSF